MSTHILRSPMVYSCAALALSVGLAASSHAVPPAASRPAQNRPAASAFIPGTGTCIDYAGDDFEDTTWEFTHRMPKSSREQDERVRGPMGTSVNDRWHEGPERGQPDQIELVPTPPNGLAGSQHALVLRTLNSGIPGSHGGEVGQDDFIANCVERLRGGIPVRERPSVTVRVYLPPAAQWEQRSGPQFGFRSSLDTITTKPPKGFFSVSSGPEVEPYWPGMWIHYRAANSKNGKAGSAVIAVRGNRMGQDFVAREITEFGWWTFGMSFSPDGMVHYYASPGVDELTAEDFITSQFPYSYTAKDFRTYFFDVCNRNDGRTWSTPFVIDDPKLYVQDAGRITSIVKRQEEAAIRNAERIQQQAERNAQRQQQLEERRAAQREAAATQREAAAAKRTANRQNSGNGQK